MISLNTEAQDNPYQLRFASVQLPPFSSKDKGQTQIRGISVEIAKAVCRDMNIHCHFQILPIRRMVNFIRNDKIDLITVIGMNDKNESRFLFSQPYIASEYGVFLHRDDPSEIKDIVDLSGYTLATLAQSNMARALKQLHEDTGNWLFRIDETLDLRIKLRQLAFKRFDTNFGVFGNRDILLSLAKEEGIQNIRYVLATDKIQYRFAASHNSPKMDLILKFYNALENLRNDGRLANMVHQYQGSLKTLTSLQ